MVTKLQMNPQEDYSAFHICSKDVSLYVPIFANDNLQFCLHSIKDYPNTF